MASFFWDKKTGRYRDANTKKFVKRSVVLKKIEIQNRRSKTYLENQAKRLVNREISLSQFQVTMTDESELPTVYCGLLASLKLFDFNWGLPQNRLASTSWSYIRDPSSSPSS